MFPTGRHRGLFDLRAVVLALVVSACNLRSKLWRACG